MKLRTILLFINCVLLIMHCQFALAQTWEPVGEGIHGVDSTYFPILTLCAYNNKLYVGGYFSSAGKIKTNNIAAWDGEKWDPMQGGVYVTVGALFEYNKFLFVGGVFSSAGKKPAINIAYWLDTAGAAPRWYYIDKGVGRIEMTDVNGKHLMLDDGVNAFEEYKGNLYVGGAFTNAGALKVGKIARWNNIHSWSTVGKSMQFKDGTYMAPGFEAGHISAMIKYKGRLYVGGEIGGYMDKSLKDIAVWNDTAFHGLSQVIPENGPHEISCMAIYDSCLYVGGTFHTNQNYGIAKWDGNKWTVIEAIQGHGQINSMTVLNGKLYIGGRFDSIGNKIANNIAVWNGKTIEHVGAGFLHGGKFKGVVNALCVYKGELYAGGSFTSSGGKTVMNIAKLNLKGTKPTSPKSKK
ncbi:MAG TPA: hypothetical protein VNZ45_16365 [Bacteroidia bacterium]|jgi:hypothetical protein|nr:hypothetical protein [Bacteroidia bacterium]